jgi:uncharacterized membrane protein YoaK (UPF0700 family)
MTATIESIHAPAGAERRDTASPALLRAPLENPRILLVILLLTLNAGWVDALAFLSLGRVFASFLSGNFVFVGLGIAHGQSGLMIRAVVALVASFAGSTLAALRLQRALARRTEPSHRNTFVPILLIEGLPLLAFAIVWRVTSDLAQHAGVQVLLLALAGFAMGIQGALVSAFNLPGVVANALTGAVITLGQRLAQRVDHPGRTSPEWRRNNTFLAILPLLYVVSASAVALTAASGFPAVMPAVIVIVAIVTFLVPSRRAGVLRRG